MSKTYKIKNLPGLSGLHCVGDYDDASESVEVTELINVGIVIGDRLLRYPIPPAALHIDINYLDEVDPISAREFSAENPYGEFKYEGRFEKDDLTIAHAVYEHAITVTIYEKSGEDLRTGIPEQRTLYTGNFFENKVMAAEIVDELLHGRMDPDDVIFELKRLEDR